MSSGPIMKRVIDRARHFFPYYDPRMLPVKTRERQFVLPRQYVWYLLRTHGMSYPWIAKNTGGWDHSTVVHGVRMHAQRSSNNNSLLYKVSTNMQNAASIVDEINNVRTQIADIEKQIEAVSKQRRELIYKLNDLVEASYANTDNGAADDKGTTTEA